MGERELDPLMGERELDSLMRERELNPLMGERELDPLTGERDLLLTDLALPFPGEIAVGMVFHMAELPGSVIGHFKISRLQQMRYCNNSTSSLLTELASIQQFTSTLASEHPQCLHHTALW